MNPPYGVRLKGPDKLEDFYRRMGQWMKHSCVGWTVCCFSADRRLPALVGLAPSRRIPLFNGALECRLYVFPIVEGSLRRRGRRPPESLESEASRRPA